MTVITSRHDGRWRTSRSNVVGAAGSSTESGPPETPTTAQPNQQMRSRRDGHSITIIGPCPGDRWFVRIEQSGVTIAVDQQQLFEDYQLVRHAG